MRFVREQFYLAATAQNLKRLVRFLSRKSTPQMATARTWPEEKKKANNQVTRRLVGTEKRVVNRDFSTDTGNCASLRLFFTTIEVEKQYGDISSILVPLWQF